MPEHGIRSHAMSVKPPSYASVFVGELYRWFPAQVAVDPEIDGARRGDIDTPIVQSQTRLHSVS